MCYGADRTYVTQEVRLKVDVLDAALPKLVDSKRREAGFAGVAKMTEGTPSPTSPVHLSRQAQLAVLTFVGLGLRDAEIDVLLGNDEDFLPITVFDDGALLVVEEGQTVGPAQLFPRGPSLGSLTRRGVAVRADDPWDRVALGVVERALDVLSEPERALVADVVFRREAKAPPELPQATALYHESREATVSLFDRAMLPSARFIGSPSAPWPMSAKTVVHELGHALSARPRRRMRELIAQRQGRTISVEAKTRFEALGVELFDQDSPAARAFAKLRPPSRGVTPYGRTSVEESFAEAFALYHLDPDALRRIDPAVHAWFAEAGHLRATEAALAAVEKLASL